VQLYVARNTEKELVGYIQWLQKSGFRQEVVLELEQIAVHPKYQEQGFGVDSYEITLKSLLAL